MTIGHPNAGYDEIVSKFKLGLDNPTGARAQFKRNNEELADIREAAKAVWSAKDNFQTTYSRYHGPHKHEGKLYRPSSPSRKNNPHPTKVFLTTRMSHIPGHFDDSDFENKSRTKIRIPEYNNIEHKDIILPSMKRYANTQEYLQSLTDPNEASNVEESLRNAGIDPSTVTYTPSAREEKKERTYLSYDNKNFDSRSLVSLHNNTTGDSEYRDHYQGKSSADEIDPIPLKLKRSNSSNCLQTNATNPYLYNDYRVYREKYANGDHGVPNPDAKKPSRGEFLIHPDWHARLKHHRLPYYGTLESL